MTLCVLKHFNSWYKHAADFRCQPAAFERLVTKVINAVEPVRIAWLIRPPVMTCTFANSPCALYATDVKFQQANQPSGTFADAKRYFSFKRSRYGFKFEYSVGPDGQCAMR
jgi:hypothetical protein